MLRSKAHIKSKMMPVIFLCFPLCLYAFVPLCLFLSGCVGIQIEAPLDFESRPMEYNTVLDTNETWKTLLRFVSQNDFRFVRLESEKDIMEFTTGERYEFGNETCSYKYHFILVGLARGTKVVIGVTFHSTDDSEIEPADSMKKTKYEAEQKMHERIKAFFQEEEQKK